MNELVDEINDRLRGSVSDSDFEMQETDITVKDYEYYEAKKLEEAPDLVKEQEKNNSQPVVDSYTGEIRRYRSAGALGTFCKKEICTEPTETDSKMYEPLETTIEKCSRAPALRQLMMNEAMFTDGSPDPDMDKDFDETLRSGYDITDAAETMQQIGDALATPRTTNDAQQSAKDEKEPEQAAAE